MDLAASIADLAAAPAADAGLVVDDVRIARAGKRTRVVVSLDLPETDLGSADLDSIAHASRAIGLALDDANVPATPYVLEVGTPGTDRPLTDRRHFLRARTRLVRLDRTGVGSITGRLLDVHDDILVLDAEGVRTEVDLNDVVSGRIVVELTRLD